MERAYEKATAKVLDDITEIVSDIKDDIVYGNYSDAKEKTELLEALLRTLNERTYKKK